MNDTFRTVVPVSPNPRSIELGHSILCLGSCFAETIGAMLADNCFKICVNPFGPLFNPLSISQNLRRLIVGNPFSADDLFEQGGLWHSFAHHGSFSTPDPQASLAKINDAFAAASATLAHLDTLIVTLGTAWVFVDRSSGSVVANCHKLPDSRFERRLASIDEIVQSLDIILGDLYSAHPMANIIVTVSPVRHLRDNPHENSVSKAFLMAASFELEKRFPALYYFPSYEIMMDELRDYRFYGTDLTHPNETAIQYIGDRFHEACLSDRSRTLVERLMPIRAAANHRIVRGESAAAEAFTRSQLDKIEMLRRDFPEIDFSPVANRLG